MATCARSGRKNVKKMIGLCMLFLALTAADANVIAVVMKVMAD